MDPKVIKKVGNDVDPLTQTLIDFQKSDPQMYNQLFAATSIRFHQTNGSAPSSHVNKTGFVQYQNDLSNEFNNIVKEFTGADGKVDRTKAALMIKKYATGTIRSDKDFTKAITAYQKKYDVSPKYYNKSLSSAENSMKNDPRGNFKIMGTPAMYDFQGGMDFIKKKEEEGKENFVRAGGTIKRIR